MKKRLIACTTAVVALTTAQNAASDNFFDDVTLVPQLGFQWKTLDFEQDLTGGDILDDEKGDLDVDLPSVSLSLTAIYQKFYVSMKYEGSVSNNSTDSDVPFTSGTDDFGNVLDDTEVDREDFSISLGYNVWEGMNLFVGYLDGKTTLEPTAISSVTNGLGETFYPKNYEQKYEEDGWYFGASYGWRLFNAGTLTVNAAYADLDATYKDNFGSGEDFKFTGDADGYSAGITWSAPLTEKVGYYLDARMQSFDADADEDNGNFPNSKAETQEDITAFTAGIQWYL